MQRTDFDGEPGMAEESARRAVRPPGLMADLDELKRAVFRDRWGLGLMAIGWVHLATFLVCYAMYRAGRLDPPPYVALWMVEFVVVALMLRRIVTANGRRKAPPLVGLLARVWITFIILGLSVASLNRLTGMPPEWFKPVWGTLSTFGFAMLAWIVSLWFLVPAVQMSLTAMLIAVLPREAYLIYGLSWFIALHAVGITLERVSRASRVRESRRDSKTRVLEQDSPLLVSESPELSPLLSTTS